MAQLNVRQDPNMDGFATAKRRDTFYPGGISTREYRTPYRTRIVIEGPLPNVCNFVQQYRSLYPTPGYGTAQRDCVMGSSHARYVIDRANSCD